MSKKKRNKPTIIENAENITPVEEPQENPPMEEISQENLINKIQNRSSSFRKFANELSKADEDLHGPWKDNLNNITPVVNKYPNKADYYVLVAGSRILNDYDLISKYLDEEFKLNSIDNRYNIIIVQGEATGVDALAKRYAMEHHYECKCFPAQWALYGAQAGFLRNKKMHAFIANYPNRICICFKALESTGKGTSHSIDLGKKYKTNVVFYTVSNNGTERAFYNNSEV